METQTREERRWYARGYDDGRVGLRAYNDANVDLTGSLTVLRFGGSSLSDAYAQGFSDAVQNGARESALNRCVRISVQVVLLALGLAAWW